MRLDGQTAIVIGASRGLGRAIALAMAEEGATVVLAARDTHALNTVASLIDGLGRRALVVRCDIRRGEEVDALVQRTLDELGQIDTLVNSAGVSLHRRFTEIMPEDWDELYSTVVRGAMLAIQGVLPGMIARERGNIINLVAPLGHIERPGYAAYTSAKYAVVGLTRTLATELRPYGINVNGLHPGASADTRTARAMLEDSATSEGGLLDPAIVTPAAIALAAQPPRGLTGDIIDALAWNTDSGLGAGMG